MNKRRKPPRQSRVRRTRDTRESHRRRAPRIPFPSQQSRLDDNALNDVEVLKFTYAMWVQNHPNGGKQMARLENALKAGRLAFLPKNEVEHWGMEEYLWHGMPGHDWDPIEAFLEGPGQTLSESGRKQFRRWKEMRIGFYEIGRVGDRTVEMWAWDHLNETRIGDSFQAVSCGIGGAEFYRKYVGQLIVTYVCFWQPDQNIFCTGGYGTLLEKDDLKGQEWLLGLSRPDILIKPLKFSVGSGERPLRQQREIWKNRNWHGWLKKHLDFPFRAILSTPIDNKLQPVQITSIIEMTADKARRKGVYFQVDKKSSNIWDVVGGVNILAADILSANFLPLLEYQTYREWAGPPPEAPKSKITLARNL